MYTVLPHGNVLGIRAMGGFSVWSGWEFLRVLYDVYGVQKYEAVCLRSGAQ